MRYRKKVISNLHLCYSLAELTCRGEHCFLAAAEKHDPCYLFSEDGIKKDTVWDGPGGVMSMEQVPGVDGQFLATQEFYSPNDSQNSRIVVCTLTKEGTWETRTLIKLPFVHRFGILKRNGVYYLIICCLKSRHEYKDDWRFPGAVYGAVLPENLSQFNEKNQLSIYKIKGDMLKNHGYCTYKTKSMDQAVIACEEGVFLFIPPEEINGKWEIKKLLNIPASDAVLWDFDNDGQPEIGVIENFHGDRFSIYHLNKNKEYEKCWQYEEKLEMLHAIWAGKICGTDTLIVGNRKGKKKTLAVFYENDDYRYKIIEEDAGAANVLHFVNEEGKDVLVAANREIDQITMFIFEE